MRNLTTIETTSSSPASVVVSKLAASSSAAGKLLLAAIVHYNDGEEGHADLDCDSAHEQLVAGSSDEDGLKSSKSSRRSSLASQKKLLHCGHRSEEDKMQIDNARKTTTTTESFRSRATRRLFSAFRTRSTSSNKQSRPREEQLEMGVKRGEPSKQIEQEQDAQLAGAPIASGRAPRCADQEQPEPAKEPNQQQQHHQQQVIEFKFDLIVQLLQSGEKLSSHLDANLQKIAQQQQSKLPKSTPLKSSWRGGQWAPLAAPVEAAVRAFAIDSSDVCFMSISKQQERRLQRSRWRANRIGCLTDLAAHTLKQTFEHHIQQQQQQPDPTSTKSTTSNASGVEISAALVLTSDVDSRDFSINYHQSSGEAGGAGETSTCNGDQICSIVDLLKARKCDINDTETSANGKLGSTTPTFQLTQFECSSHEQGLAVLRNLESEFAMEAPKLNGKFLLLISFKLKRIINGGLFTNSLCLIEYDPSITQLNTIFESIFSGQALAHLQKSQKKNATNNHCPAPLESGRTSDASGYVDCLGGIKLISTNSSNNYLYADQSSSNTQDNSTISPKQIHPLASKSIDNSVDDLQRQAEWLLYKHLSSALIRTVLLVHVRAGRTDPSSTPPTATTRVTNDVRLRENLKLLKFAHSLQRASQIRLRRRKQLILLSKQKLASSNKLDLLGNSPSRNAYGGCSNQQNLTLGSRKKFANQMSGQNRRLDPLATPVRKQSHHYQRSLGNNHTHNRRRRFVCNESTGRVTPTESSSQSVSSSNNCCFSPSVSRLNGIRQRIKREGTTASSNTKSPSYATTTTTVHSDTDSLASTNLNSLLINGSNARNQNSVNYQSSHLGIYKPHNQMELKSTSSILIDVKRLMSMSQTTTSQSSELSEDEDNQDDAQSDIQSLAMAEPLKQLKLERYLDNIKLVSTPAPASLHATQSTNCILGYDYDANSAGLQEDEDCKSHSSILEHLSALAHESRLKQQAEPTTTGSPPSSTSSTSNSMSSSNNTPTANKQRVSDKHFEFPPAPEPLDQLCSRTDIVNNDNIDRRVVDSNVAVPASTSCGYLRRLLYSMESSDQGKILSFSSRDSLDCDVATTRRVSLVASANSHERIGLSDCATLEHQKTSELERKLREISLGLHQNQNQLNDGQVSVNTKDGSVPFVVVEPNFWNSPSGLPNAKPHLRSQDSPSSLLGSIKRTEPVT